MIINSIAFFLVSLMSNWQNCMNVKPAAWCFSVCIHWEMITAVKFIKASITLRVVTCVWSGGAGEVRRLKIYSHRFWIYGIVWLTIVGILCIRFPELNSSYSGKLVPFDQHLLPSSTYPNPWQPHVPPRPPSVSQALLTGSVSLDFLISLFMFSPTMVSDVCLPGI